MGQNRIHVTVYKRNGKWSTAYVGSDSRQAKARFANHPEDCELVGMSVNFRPKKIKRPQRAASRAAEREAENVIQGDAVDTPYAEPDTPSEDEELRQAGGSPSNADITSLLGG